MKKLLTAFLLLILSSHAFSQGENELKNFRFGLKGSMAFDWMKTDGKKLESNGVKVKAGYGLMMEFRLSSIICFGLGLQVDYAGGSLNFKDSAFYFVSDDAFISVKDTAGKKADQYFLTKRDYKMTYVTLPLTLKMRTKEIGAMTYFGQFGFNLGFRLKATVDDELKSVGKTAPFTIGSGASQTGLDNGKDMGLFNVALNIGGGAEYNISGSTSLVFGVNYLGGFVNQLHADSKYVQKGVRDITAYKQAANLKAFAITVGILF